MATEPTPTDALEPCPFCGGGARRVKHSAGVQGTTGHDQWHGVSCATCNACVGASDRRFRTPPEAIAAWNRRAQPAPAASQKPLTVEQIKEICRQHIARDKSKDEPNTGAWPDSVALARAIERAHGIGIKGGRNVDHPV
jgi:Lar family restriction alleviation protein